MKLTTDTLPFETIPSPCFVLDERLLNNLAVIDRVRREAGVEIIVALKASALWSIFPTLREHSDGATASSIAEAQLVVEEFGARAHTYAPVYKESEWDEVVRLSDYVTFNSLAQAEKFGARAAMSGISCGLRINPQHSTIGVEIYDPSSAGSRLGVLAENLTYLPDYIEGLHFHNLCEGNVASLEATLNAVEQRFGHLLGRVKWLNMGGGHLMTSEYYNVNALIHLLKNFKKKHPHLRIILEPGAAFMWRTGYLIATVEDIVRGGGVWTAMLDVSFACHMPDVLEMPYKPAIIGAHDPVQGEMGWRMGGNSCLAGDFCGDWAFDVPPQVGSRIIFEDMMHYTVVKTTMFNGVSHPPIAIWSAQNELKIVRKFGYEDYKNRVG